MTVLYGIIATTVTIWELVISVGRNRSWMLRCSVLVLLWMAGWGELYAQSRNVGIGIATPDASAILELSSTQKGFLVPRMTTIQRDSIRLPATSLLIYNTSITAYQYNIGTSLAPTWVTLMWTRSPGGNADRLYWSLTGNDSLQSTAYLGSRDSSVVRFATNGIVRMSIAPGSGDIAMQTLTGTPQRPTLAVNDGLVMADASGTLTKRDASDLLAKLGIASGRYTNATADPQFTVVINLPLGFSLDPSASITITPEASISVSVTPVVVSGSRTPTSFTVNFPGGLNTNESLNWFVKNP